jgi:hypothetical protein
MKVPMPDVLDLVEERLRPRATRTGFALADAGTSGTDDGLRLLEYRRETPGQSMVLLDISALPAPPRITAELWSASDLVRVTAEGSVADVVIQSRTWTLAPSADQEELAGEIAGEVGAWLEQIGTGAGTE